MFDIFYLFLYALKKNRKKFQYTSCETFPHEDLNGAYSWPLIPKIQFHVIVPWSFLFILLNFTDFTASFFSPALKIDTIFALRFHWAA